MKKNRLLKKAKFLLQYFPFSLNAFVLGIALWLCILWLKSPDTSTKDTDSFFPIVLLLGKIACWFLAALISFSIFSTLICWLVFLFLKGKYNDLLDVKFEDAGKGKGIEMETILSRARRPFLGYIKGRLFYDDRQMTEKFILASNKKGNNRFWREAVLGRNKLELPDIKEYTLEGGFVYFEDMLQLLSLPVRQNLNGHFFKEPRSYQQEEQQVLPRKTEEEATRIDQLRKVQGEYLNYKDFESGDDVRRIVWKVYAKNRELMVRIPEIFDPYASHIYYYASFFKSRDFATNEYSNEMLNYYKSKVWSIYNTLSKDEFEVRFVPDQQLHIPEQLTKDILTKRIISTSHWQQDLDLDHYFEPRYGSVLVISSFNNPDEIKNTLDQCNADVTVYFVKLSDTFKSFAPLTWFLRIFIAPPNDRLKRLKSRWLLVPMRWKLRKTEQQIEKILSAADCKIYKL